MLHNGAGTSGGWDGSAGQKQFHRHEENTAELPRSQPKSTRDSPLTSTQSTHPKGADNTNKPYLQNSLPRPSVLRKGNQTLPHALPNQSGHSNWSKGIVCKAELENHSVDTLPYTKDSPRDNSSGPNPMQSPPEHHADSPQAGEGVLYVKGVCRWPGCKEIFKEYSHFLKHLYSEHGSEEKTIEQWKKQKDMVQEMENQLIVERHRLQAMYIHLSGIRPFAESSPSLKQSSSTSGSLQPFQGTSLHSNNRATTEMLSPGYWQIPTAQFIPGIIPSIEYYKYTNIRPPFTYASMIRWAILESPEKQLTLNEIYNWFTRMFSYFRHHTATWKNAVRHNLSLHKCFVRVEGGKGSVWTVDEAEFLRRKGQKLHRDQDLSLMAHYSMVFS